MAQDYYSFIIDTTAYSGNFEREMTAFMTGKVGECEVGDNFAEMFHQDVPGVNFGEIIYRKMDDEYGVCRPCEIAVTPGYVNNGMGKQVPEDSEEAKSFTSKYPAYQSIAIFFHKDPSEYIALMKERAHEFAEYYNKFGNYGREPSEKITVTGFRLLQTETKTKIQELHTS